MEERLRGNIVALWCGSVGRKFGIIQPREGMAFRFSVEKSEQEAAYKEVVSAYERRREVELVGYLLNSDDKIGQSDRLSYDRVADLIRDNRPSGANYLRVINISAVDDNS